MSKYSILPSDDDVSPNRSSTLFAGPSRLPKSTLVALLIIFTSTISGIGGYLAGKRLRREESEGLVQLNRVPITFEYELNFSGPPSNITNQRWESLFPTYGGFFTHPTMGPDQVAFSVFHQLHCLDGIRHAYWAARNGNHSEGEQEEGHSHSGDHSSDVHVRHCIEFIRQSLICAADTTVEQTVKASDNEVGVPGFGTEHMCKNYHQLVEWTSQWEDPKTI